MKNGSERKEHNTTLTESIKLGGGRYTSTIWNRENG